MHTFVGHVVSRQSFEAGTHASCDPAGGLCNAADLGDGAGEHLLGEPEL